MTAVAYQVPVNRRQLKTMADEVLREATDKLQGLSFETIASWPDWPATPEVDLHIPDSLAKYHFGLMKDVQKDASKRVTVQRYRYYFLGIGEMTADGFFIFPGGEIRRFTQHDIWEVT